MSLPYKSDILFEIHDLFHSVMHTLQYDFQYYKASIYKEEAAAPIRRKVEQLRFLANLLKDDLICDVFRDYDAEATLHPAQYPPGECPFFARCQRLVGQLSSQLAQFYDRLQQLESEQGVDYEIEQSAIKVVRDAKKHRRQLLSICRQGTRPWAYFQTL